MKKTGTKSDYEEDRKNDLMRVYHELLSSTKNIDPTKIYEDVVKAPAKRFWISEERAAIVLSRMMKGDKLKNMRPTKRKMFKELYRRVVAIRKKCPDLSITYLAYKVVNQPAPEFYMKAGYARNIIIGHKRKWFAERRKKLRFLF